MMDIDRLQIRIMTLEQQVESLLEADRETRLKTMQSEIELIFARANKKSFDLELFLSHYKNAVDQHEYPHLK